MSTIGKLSKFKDIYFYKGTTAFVDCDCRRFDFNNGYVVFTIRDDTKKLIKRIKLDKQELITLVFSDEFTRTLVNSHYFYDLTHIYDNETIKLCEDSDIYVKQAAGGYDDGPIE